MKRNTRNHYSARRDFRTGRWQGWMTYAGSPRNVIFDANGYVHLTKQEALIAIKEQHPNQLKESPMPRKSTTRPCTCNTTVQYALTADDFPELEGEERENFAEYNVYGPCGANTRGGLFAPGHDAKLKGLLIKLRRAGQDYAYIEGSTLRHVDPLSVAMQYGWSKFITHQPKRRTRSTRSAQGNATPQAQFPKAVQVKIGRWTYNGQQLSDGRVLYQDRKGNTLEAPAGKVVAA